MVFAMAWLVLEGMRLVLVLSYLPPASSASWYEWGQAFWTGGRFDAKWLAIWLLPALARFLIKPEKLAGKQGGSLFAH